MSTPTPTVHGSGATLANAPADTVGSKTNISATKTTICSVPTTIDTTTTGGPTATEGGVEKTNTTTAFGISPTEISKAKEAPATINAPRIGACGKDIATECITPEGKEMMATLLPGTTAASGSNKESVATVPADGMGVATAAGANASAGADASAGDAATGNSTATTTKVVYIVPEQTPPAVRLVLERRPGWVEWDPEVHWADEVSETN